MPIQTNEIGKISQVDNQLKEQMTEILMLETAVDELILKLEKVLAPAEMELVDKEAVKEKEILVQLAAVIRGQNIKIQNIARKVKSIHSRLEV